MISTDSKAIWLRVLRCQSDVTQWRPAHACKSALYVHIILIIPMIINIDFQIT